MKLKYSIPIGILAVFWLVLSAVAQITEFVPRGMGGGGALFFPAISPHDTSSLYIACDMGEFFHSTDQGLNWSVPPYTQLQSSNLGRVQFSSDPQILYALQGGDVPGISKSSDGGLSWSPLAADPTNGEAYSLFVDPSRSTRLIVSDYTHMYLSTDGGATFNLRYTFGSGLHIAGAIFVGDSIYVGTSAGLLVSTNGGISFVLGTSSGIPAGETFLSFCGATQAGVVRLFAITADNGDVYPGIGGADYGIYQGLYSLEVGQAAWTMRTTGVSASDRLFYIGCARQNTQVVYASGSNESSGAPIVLKTTNAGAYWSSVFLTSNNQNIVTGWCGHQGDLNWGWAEAPLGFTVAAHDPLRLLITDFGFAHYSSDGGANWRQVYTSSSDDHPAGAATPKWRAYHSNGLEPTAVWNIAWADSLTMIGCYTDIGGTRSTDGGVTWAKLAIDTNRAYSVNTVYHAVKHPTTGVLYAATSSVHDLYQSTYLTDGNIDGGRGQVWYSTNAGASWALLHDFLHPVIWLADDPANANRLYASVVHSSQGGIYMTENLQDGPSSTWTNLAVPPRTQGHPFNIFVLNDGTLISTYSGRRAGSPLAFTQSSGVFVSTNSGASWLDRSHADMIYWTKDLAIDPFDPAQNAWYVTVRRGWGGPPNNAGGLFRTTNRGQSWTRIHDELFAESCRPSPTDSNELYLTTSADGLWYTSNLRSATPTFTLINEYTFRHATRVFYNPFDANQVWVCSFGNGMRVGSTASLLATPNDVTLAFASGTLIIRWLPVAGAQSYRIYTSVTAEDPVPALLTTTTSTFAALSSANPRTFFTIRASDELP